MIINDFIQALSRVVAVSGDITEDRLGLCAEEENLLAQTVISFFFLEDENVHAQTVISIF